MKQIDAFDAADIDGGISVRKRKGRSSILTVLLLWREVPVDSYSIDAELLGGCICSKKY